MTRTEQIKDAGRRPAEAYAAIVHLVSTLFVCSRRLWPAASGTPLASGACSLRDVAPFWEASRRPHRRGGTDARPQAERVPARWRTRRCDGHWHGERGFTLIELLVVVIILGLLVGLVGPRLFGRVGQSKQEAARIQIELFGAVLDHFRLDVGRYPASQEGLQALQSSPGNVPGWAGPYLRKDVPRDPWGNPYHYKSPGDHGEYDLWSHGADNAPGGEGEAADVTSWSREGKG